MKQVTFDREAWRFHLKEENGRILKRFTWRKYNVRFIEVVTQYALLPCVTYRFRMFFFPRMMSVPVLILNLELVDSTQYEGGGITCCYGAHLASWHLNFGEADWEMPADQFEAWALEKAQYIFEHYQETLDFAKGIAQGEREDYRTIYIPGEEE